MCLGIPAEVVEILEDRPQSAKVEVSGVRRVVHIGLLEDEGVAPGDWVLVHVGFAMSKIDAEEARLTLSYLEDIGQAYQDELAALSQPQSD